MLSRRSLFAYVIGSALSVTLPAQAGSPPVGKDQPLKIGVVAPLTGSAASYGEKIKAAAFVWQGMVNAQGGILDHQVSLVIEDDAGDPKQAVSTANRVVESGAFAVLGHGLSSTTLPAESVYVESNLLLLAMANADSITMPPSPYVVRILPRNRDYALRVAQELVRKASLDTGAIFAVDDATNYGRGMIDDMLLFLPRSLSMRIQHLSVNKGDVDYNAVISRMKKAQGSIVILSVDAATAGSIVRQAADQAFHPAILGHSTLTFPEFGNMAAGVDADTTVVALPGADLLTSRKEHPVLSRAFLGTGQELTDVALVTFSALDLLRQAALRTGSVDSQKISAALHAGTFNSPTGALQFDADGNLTLPSLVVYRWVKNENGAAALRAAPYP